jgi:hypothetical protein
MTLARGIPGFFYPFHHPLRQSLPRLQRQRLKVIWCIELDNGSRKLLVDAHVHGVVSRAVHPKLFIASNLMRIEEIGDTFDLDVRETGANWALFQLRLSPRNDPVELHLHRLGANVRLGDHFGAKGFLQPCLSRFAVVQDTRDGSLKTFRHLVTRVVSPVPIFDQAHECSHENAHRVIPPGRRETPVGRVLSELWGYSEALALPRGLEPLFSP